jgi:hypothetical protein
MILRIFQRSPVAVAADRITNDVKNAYQQLIQQSLTDIDNP